MSDLLHTRDPSRRQLLWFTVLTAATLLAAGAWTQRQLGDRLLPHAFCISASQPLLLLHLVSDALIALAYLLIPSAILNFTQRRADLPFGWIAWVFGAFIVACGLTHALEVWTLWYPAYWYSGVAKAFTAVVSLGTAWLLFRLTPVALAIPSAAELRSTNERLEREVAARIRAERELAMALAQLRQLHERVQGEARTASAVVDRFFDEAPIGLALVGPDGRVLRVNRTLVEKSGRERAEYAGGELATLRDVDPAIVNALRKVRGGAPSLTLETSRHSRGEERILRSTLFGIPVEGGARLAGMVVIDVTAEQQLARERARSIEALRDADRRKDDFIAVLAHELRNPLMPITTAAAVLLRRVEPRLAPMAEMIRRQVSHMGRLLDDALDVARIVRGKLEVRPERCDLANLGSQVAQDYRPMLDAAGCSLEVEAAPTPLPVEADPVRITQALGNLLQNAAKFAPNSEVRLRMFQDGREAVVTVEDRGPGISPDVAPRLFTPFEQGKQELAREHGGLGLGLALAKGIVELHGGSVWGGTASAGTGAAFQLRLPLAAA